MKKILIILTLLCSFNIQVMDLNSTNTQEISSSWSFFIDACKFFALPAFMAVRYRQLYLENIQLEQEKDTYHATSQKNTQLVKEKTDLLQQAEYLSQVNTIMNNAYKVKEASERNAIEELQITARQLEHELKLRETFENLTPEEKKRWIRWEDVE